MLLSTLMQGIVKYIDTHPLENGCLIIKVEASMRNMTPLQFLCRMDARNLGTLRILVPNAFPKKMRTGELVARVGLHGVWHVEPKGETRP